MKNLYIGIIAVLGMPCIAFGQGELELSSISLRDESLQSCVQAEAAKKGWAYAGDVTALNCNGKGISQVDDIKAFPNLEKASFFRNKIVEAQITELPMLEHLNLANNRLESIDISGADKLGELYLFNNKLSDFDATGLAALKKLRINENKLESIKLENLEALEKVYLFDNQLPDLDLSTNLPKLSFVDARSNPMPDEVYDYLDSLEGITIPHDGNAEDWE